MFSKHFTKYCKGISEGLFRYTPEPETIALVTRSALDKLPNHLHVIHDYVDDALGLEQTLRVKMEQMTSAKFERVLHPIFEEDELTLILAGAFLGFVAGLIQQGLETGTLKMPPSSKFVPKPARSAYNYGRNTLQKTINRIRLKFRKKNEGSEDTERPPEEGT